ncbi:hypothetical protein HZB00_02660 [Candidatus Woesearchaeota archaeon]|nr:hypothetical protein [Candidatus Woesearchaeota archaeon]
MANFWRVVNAVIDHSDLIIEVLDARFPEASRNSEVEKKVLRQHKQIIYVLNKSDLIRTPFKDIQLTFSPAVWVSAQKNLGTTQLRKLIRQL